MNQQYIRFWQGIAVFGFLAPVSSQAQVIPDNSLPNNSVVTPDGDLIQIDGGTTRGTNLFHSFQDFSVPSNNTAIFNNADAINNIFSRVTGGRESIIDGGIGANGTANVFLINPAGIIFNENAFLNVGGSFIGSTADSLLFPDGIEYSAINLDTLPVLTINAPIGLGFRDNPGDIVNRSVLTDDTGEDLTGLRVFEDNTLALIGGNVFIEGGFLSTIGGRIELGSVAENSTVSITPVEKGFDFDYEEASGFQDITLSFAAFINNTETNPGNIELQGRNISLIEGSGIAVTGFEGQAENINIVATESLTLNGNATSIFHNVSFDATAEGSGINITTPQLSITNGSDITTVNDSGAGKAADININAAEISIAEPFILETEQESIRSSSGIFSNVFEEATGNGGNINIITDNLALNEGGQIVSGTFGVGNGGNLTIDASESIELTGTLPNSTDPSAILASVGEPFFPIASAGNGGDITIDTPRLTVRDGAQIGTSAQNNGNGGNLTINASESVLLSGTSDNATLQLGRSGIFVNVEPAFEDAESAETVPTTGNGGTLNLTTPQFVVEEGAIISANTFSQGNGGDANINVSRLIVRNGGEIGSGSLIGADSIDAEAENVQRGAGGILDVNAIESIEILGSSEIDRQSVNSSIFTLSNSNGDAGSLSLTTGSLSISNGGEINTSAIASGSAGSQKITANSVDLNDGSIIASTNAGSGGNITFEIAENLTLKENSLISARAFENASGGNLIVDSQFIIAFPSQTAGNGNDIVANADLGRGGNITITAESVFGISEQNAMTQNGSNDIDASSAAGAQFDGTVTINTSDVNNSQGNVDLPNNLIQSNETQAQACRSDRIAAAKNSFSIVGKGGISPNPEHIFNSANIIIEGEVVTDKLAVPQPVETSKGKIQPARGIAVAEDGSIILTAYRTTTSGDRLLVKSANCNGI